MYAWLNLLSFKQRLLAEKDELEREKNRLTTQKMDVEQASVQLQTDFERVSSERRDLADQLSKAKAEKCDALVRIQV